MPSFRFFVASVQADANPALHGAVVLAAGTGIMLSQVGETITIDSAGGGGDVSGPGPVTGGSLAAWDGASGTLLKAISPAILDIDTATPQITAGAKLVASQDVSLAGNATQAVVWGNGFNSGAPVAPGVVVAVIRIVNAGTDYWLPLYQ